MQKGPLVGRLLDAQLRWQLRNPFAYGEGSEAAESQEYQSQCAEYLKSCVETLQRENAGAGAAGGGGKPKKDKGKR